MIFLKNPRDWQSCRKAVRKLKNRETHDRILSLDHLGSRRVIADLFIMFIAWTRQKLQKFINVCLKVGHSANLKDSKTTWRQLIVLWKLQNHNIESSGHNARSVLLYRGDVWKRSICDNCRFDIGHFRAGRLIAIIIHSKYFSASDWLKAHS